MPIPELRPLWPYYRPYVGLLVAGILSILAMSWIGLAAPLIIGRAIDRLLEGDVSTAALLGYAGWLLGITAARGIFHFFQRYLLVKMSRNIEVDLRRDFYMRLQTLHAGFFTDRPAGDLMARATNDLEAVRRLSGPAIMYIGNTVFTAVGALYFMIVIDPGLTLLALGTLPFVAVITRVFGRRIHDLFQHVQESFSDLTAKVQENLTGARVVRAYVQEEAEATDFAEINDEYLERQRRLILWNAAFQPMIQAVVGLGFAGVLGYGGWLILEGAITIGDFVVFQLFLNRLVWPMIAIGWVVNLAQQAAASMERIRQIIDTDPAIRDRPPLVDRDRAEGAVTLDGLTFRYRDDLPPALDDLSFEVAAGETVAIVGRTGAGKSTLLSLLPRLLDPPEDSLAIDGTDVHRWPLATLRSQMAVVPQETFLFSTTVAENIAFGRPDAEPEAIARAASLAGLDTDLSGFPDGLDTLVGERDPPRPTDLDPRRLPVGGRRAHRGSDSRRSANGLPRADRVDGLTPNRRRSAVRSGDRPGRRPRRGDRQPRRARRPPGSLRRPLPPSGARRRARGGLIDGKTPRRWSATARHGHLDRTPPSYSDGEASAAARDAP
ncbi:MAG: ABC transporter ATP-binding protein [Acidobacteriota bacterium]